MSPCQRHPQPAQIWLTERETRGEWGDPKSLPSAFRSPAAISQACCPGLVHACQTCPSKHGLMHSHARAADWRPFPHPAIKRHFDGTLDMTRRSCLGARRAQESDISALQDDMACFRFRAQAVRGTISIWAIFERQSRRASAASRHLLPCSLPKSLRFSPQKSHPDRAADKTAAPEITDAVGYPTAASPVVWIQIATSTGATSLLPTRKVASAAAGAVTALLP